MAVTTSQSGSAAWTQDPRKTSLDKRLAVLFWPLMFILAGTIWLFPPQRLPDGTWLLGIGVILLSLNAARLLNGIPVRLLPTVLGALALGAGMAEYAGMALPLIPLTLIAVGASIVFELFPARKS